MLKEHKVQIDLEKCVGCGNCVKDCPGKALGLENGKAKVVNPLCIACAHCVAICPVRAVAISGFPEEAEELNGNEGKLEADEIVAALKGRRSIRQYKPTPIPKEVLKQVIEAGRWTATARNTQGVSYIILQKNIGICEKMAVAGFRKMKNILQKLYKPLEKMEITDDFFFFGAPVAILVMSDNKIDAGLAAANMTLVAEANGLGTLYSGFFTIAVNKFSRLRKALKLSKKDKAAITIVLGYPDVKYHRTALRESARVKAF